ncbi:hypothetical protein L9F63_017185, partial [Diploptera punctata]
LRPPLWCNSLTITTRVPSSIRGYATTVQYRTLASSIIFLHSPVSLASLPHALIPKKYLVSAVTASSTLLFRSCHWSRSDIHPTIILFVHTIYCPSLIRGLILGTAGILQSSACPVSFRSCTPDSVLLSLKTPVAKCRLQLSYLNP